jgi:DNA-binding beta-propeller fold protein YncE
MGGRAVTVKHAARRRLLLRLLIAVGLGALLAAPAVASAATNLYGSDWGQGAASAFSIGPGGLLTQLGTGITSTGSQAAGVAISPGGQDLYVANNNQGTVSTFSIGPGGVLTQVGPPVLSGNSSSTTDSGPYGVAVSPDGENLYVANYASGTVSTFTIGAGGTLTQQGTGITSGSAGPGWLAVSPDGQDLYVTNYLGGTVSTFSIGAGGVLTPQGPPVSVGSGSGSKPENVAISPNGGDLYVANYGDGTVSTFSIGPGGTITTLGAPVPSGASVSSGPGGVAVSPSGHNLYVTNESEGTVSTFSIGAGGALTAQGVTGAISGTSSSSQPFGAAVSPGGENLYVANFTAGTVSTFSIGAAGALTLEASSVSGSSLGSEPYQVAVSPDRGPTADYGALVSPTAPAGTFSAQPSIAGSAPIGTYTWQFGDGTQATGPLATHTFPRRGTYTVTLTLADTDGCSVFGPFTGQSAACTLDPAASFSHAITVPAPPTVSRASLTGVGKGKPKLAFTITAGPLAPSLSTITVTPPHGLTCSSRRRNLTRDIAVKGANGKPVKFTAAMHHGALTITLASAEASANVTISSPELAATQRLMSEVKPRRTGTRGKRRNPVKLTFKLKLTDTARDAINLRIRATAA